MEKFLKTYRWGLPVLSAVLLIMAVPPIDFWGLAFFALVPLLYFTYIAQSRSASAYGWALFGFIHAGYLTHATLSGFHWLPETTLFNFFMQFGGFIAVIFVTLIFLCFGFLLGCIPKCIQSRTSILWLWCLSFLVYIGIETFFMEVYAGFNYGALFFSAQNASPVLELVDWGGLPIISAYVMVFNIALFVFGLALLKKVLPVTACTFLLPAAIFLLFPYVFTSDFVAAKNTQTVSIAIIQEASRDMEYTFGAADNETFSFPALEGHLAEISQKPVDFIVYPFAPWNGVISDSVDNSRFDRKVITVSYKLFSDWLKVHVPKDTIFVAWYTSYDAGNFYNQIGFFKNGERVSAYTKENLFPFFDYTPGWALDAGVVSLPYDATAGVDNVPFTQDGLRVGSLVCSEVGDQYATSNSAQDTNMLFSLGSETMFSHRIPGEYNALRAQLSAEKHNMPIVRANKFGPSVVFDANAVEIGRLEYEQTGVLYVDVPFVPSL